VASAKTLFGRAITAHREALGLIAAIRDKLDRQEAESMHTAQSAQEQTALAVQLERLAAEAAPAWLGAPWSVINEQRFAPGVGARPGDPVMLRVGDAQPLPGVGFPVIVPFVGVGHLTIDRDARDPAVAGLLRSVLTRLLAALPAGTLRILAVDGGALGAPLAPFHALVPAGVMNEPVSELEEFRDVLDEAEEQVRLVQSGALRDPDVIVIAAAALPPGCGRGEYSRLAALAHAGPAARVHLLLAGYPPIAGSSWDKRPDLELTTTLTADSGSRGHFKVGDPPKEMFGADGRGMNTPVTLDLAPPAGLVDELCRRIASQVESEGALNFDDLVPAELWTESSVDGLKTTIGRVGRTEALLALDDATPHWLVAGRTGAGKTVFLLDVLYGLTARYSPDELALYLLDFKEGVSFTEFIPTDRDPTWVPHARAVGVESDREYGLAVLAELVREMGRRAAAMKQAGVTNLAQLRSARRDVALPRILTVIDEFHVLFQGNDETAKRAVALLEEVARKGRSYGIHLILASQSISGIEALYAKGQSVFGQFGMRVALAGGGGILDALNPAADSLPLGHVILNNTAGTESGNRRARFPNADDHGIRMLRHRMWEMRIPGAPAPAMFIGYAEYMVDDEKSPVVLPASRRRRSAVVGRKVNIALSTAAFPLDSSPGKNFAVLGTSLVGADVLRSIAIGLSWQHDPGTATFYLVSLAGSTDDEVDELAERLLAAGHVVEVRNLGEYVNCLRELNASVVNARGDGTYVLVFGADAASSILKQKSKGMPKASVEEFRTLLRDGPAKGIHFFGWWRGVRRLGEDLGPNSKEDISGMLALNVRGNEVGLLIGQSNLQWNPRHNRALLIDRQEDTTELVVPFVTSGRYSEESE
jgi:S-DNA-T family DNA segregation ATPase FtsK/SpoIIIE